MIVRVGIAALSMRRTVEGAHRSSILETMNTLQLNIDRNNRALSDFIIDYKPLSPILDGFYRNQAPILENWVCMFGSFSWITDRFKAKQLTLAPLSDQELRELCPSTGQNTHDQAEIVQALKVEYENENIIIYGCNQCGDFYCGGFSVKVERREDCFHWLFENDDRRLRFSFEAATYCQVFQPYL